MCVAIDRIVFVLSSTVLLLFLVLFAAIEMLFYYMFVFLFVWPQTQVLTSNKVICTRGLCKETHFRLFLDVVDLIRGHYRTSSMMVKFDWFSRFW